MRYWLQDLRRMGGKWLHERRCGPCGKERGVPLRYRSWLACLAKPLTEEEIRRGQEVWRIIQDEEQAR